MALTKVTGQVINNTTGLVVGVTTVGGGLSATDGFFSGIVTAVGNASFSGNLTVGGVLTYEDVTNVDSVGLVTARNGIVVGSGITLSKDGDIFATGITTISENLKVGTGVTISPDGDAFFTGVCTATSFSGDGSNLTGISGVSLSGSTNNTVATVTGANALIGEGNLKFDGTNLGVGVDPSGVASYSTIHLKGQTSGNGGAVRLTDYGDTPDSDDFTIYKNSASGYLRINGTDPLIAYLNGADRLKIESDGDTTVSTGNLVIGTAGKGIDFSAQTASSDGGVTVGDEVLDHYEEGTWTPVLRHYLSGSFQAPAGSAGTVKGYYTRVGDVCYINATFSAFSYTNLTGSSYAQISELPFAASSSANHVSVINATGTAFSQNNVSFITSGGNTYLNSKTDDSSWDWAVIDGGSKYLYVSGFYFV